MNDRKGCSAIILEASGFTVIRSRHPDIIVFLLFEVQGVRNEIDLTVFNLERICIFRTRFIIRKGIFQHTPGIFIIGDNRADKFARLRIFMKFKRVFFLFIRRSIVHIINLDLDIDTIRKRRVSSIGHDKMDNVFILDFIVQYAVLSHLDNTIDIRKRLVIIRSDFWCRDRILRRFASSAEGTLAVIIYGKHFTDFSSLQSIFVNSKDWNIRENRPFIYIFNIDRYNSFLFEFLIRNDDLESIEFLGFVIELCVIDRKDFASTSINIEQGRFFTLKREIQCTEAGIIDIRIFSLCDTQRGGLRCIFTNLKVIRRILKCRFFIHVDHSDLCILRCLISLSVFNRQCNIKYGITFSRLIKLFIIKVSNRLDHKLAL